MSNENVKLSEVELIFIGNNDVTAVVANIGPYLAVGTSRRDPADKADPVIGANLAAGRAIRQLGRHILSETNKAIRQAAYAAERQREAQALVADRKERALDDRLGSYSAETLAAPVTVIDGPPAPPIEHLPLVQEADPEIEKLLEEEEAIERSVHAINEPDGQDDDARIFTSEEEFYDFLSGFKP